MTYPMPPELLDQLGLEACADSDPRWPEDHDALGWGRRVRTTIAGDQARGRRCSVVADALYTSLAEYLAANRR